ncbi:MAG: hypothetical protein J6U49_05370 [Alistipes sp.]|nr:hypothetical protein [Alistipes sp.]
MSHYTKSNEGYDVKVPSNGQVNLNTVLGSIGTAGALGILNGNNCNGGGFLGNLFGGNCNNNGCNTVVTRYELGMQNEIAARDSKIALLEANIYGDQKLLEVYKYVDGELKDIRAELGRQAVINERTSNSIIAVQSNIEREAERRCCADNAIITYTNATFYPKMVADVTTGTTTTAQTLYNPLPICNCGCGNS